jgi:DNA repair protein RadC
MIRLLTEPGTTRRDVPQSQMAGMIGYLRRAVLGDDPSQERCQVIYLDDRRFYLGDATLGRGGKASVLLHMREVLSEGLRLGANCMVLAHNHPSGDCRPSHRDIVATQRLTMIGSMVQLELLDHLIITPASVFSMRAAGLM